MNGVTKESLRSLQSSHFVAPRAFDETKRIERFLTAARQQGTGYKLILLLKHCQLSKCGVYSINVSHNHLGLWSNLIVTSLGHGSALHTLKLRGCGLDDECELDSCILFSFFSFLKTSAIVTRTQGKPSMYTHFQI